MCWHLIGSTSFADGYCQKCLYCPALSKCPELLMQQDSSTCHSMEGQAKIHKNVCVTWRVPKFRAPEKEIASSCSSQYAQPCDKTLALPTSQWRYLVLLCFPRQSAIVPIVSSLRVHTSLLCNFQPLCNHTLPLSLHATHCTPLDTQAVTALRYWHLLQHIGKAGDLQRQPESLPGHICTDCLHLETHAWLRAPAFKARTWLQHTATQELQPAQSQQQ